jgi:transketolase
VGVSVAAGYALAQQQKKSGKYVYAVLGDGEMQEGQVSEMMHFAAKYALDNFVVFVDYNRVQLTDALVNIMPIDPAKLFLAAGWEVIQTNGHCYQSLWAALRHAKETSGKPIVIIGETVMGNGVVGMEEDGLDDQATWHGKAPSSDQAEAMLTSLELSEKQQRHCEDIRSKLKWNPSLAMMPVSGKRNSHVDMGNPIVYSPDVLTDCRSAYGAALVDLADVNNNIVALTADLAGSVKTSGLKKKYPEKHIECGIAEQHMVSCVGGMNLAGYIPFCSTFGAFMTSRAKDQARVNDINQVTVNMVATHCGLSVGKDGPTHQAIDDSGSMLGLLNTLQMEPADPNHCDRIIRFAAGHYGNKYIRMGRHKLPVLTKENGRPFFSKSYKYKYGRCDLLRAGSDVSIIAIGATVAEALEARAMLLEKHKISAEIVIASSIKQFDTTLFDSIQKTKRVLTVEDHNTASGLGSQVAKALMQKGVMPERFEMLGVDAYQLSGTAKELYRNVGIDARGIVKSVRKMMT